MIQVLGQAKVVIPDHVFVRSPRALLVEDNSYQRQLLATTLEGLGVQVVVQTDASAPALQAFSHSLNQGPAFDVAFIDMNLDTDDRTGFASHGEASGGLLVVYPRTPTHSGITRVQRV